MSHFESFRCQIRSSYTAMSATWRELEVGSHGVLAASLLPASYASLINRKIEIIKKMGNGEPNSTTTIFNINWYTATLFSYLFFYFLLTSSPISM